MYEYLGIDRHNPIVRSEFLNNQHDEHILCAPYKRLKNNLSKIDADVLRKLRHTSYEEEKQLCRDKPRKGKHKVTYGEKIKWLKEERQKSNQ